MINTHYETKDSGVREEQGTGAIRDSRDGKGRYDLLPSHAIRRIAQVYERGAKKYASRNWEKGMPLSRYLDSALRHIFQHLEGARDEDHLGHATFNLLAIMEHEERILRGTLDPSLDDRPEQKKLESDPRVFIEPVIRGMEVTHQCRCDRGVPTEQPRLP